MNSTPIIRVGVLGAGRIVANAFVPALHKVAGASLEAVASRDRERAAALGPARAYDAYQKLIEDPEIDLVYVATHNGLHMQQTIACLEAGKHVLCEKPLGLSPEECTRMMHAAKHHDRVLVEGFMYRYHPQIARAQELVAAGAIGELRTVEASFSFAHDFPGDVRLNPEWGGGALLDVGCYTVNACRLFLGDEPQQITARGWKHPQHGVDFAVNGILDYGDGRYGVISCGFDSGLRTFVALSGTQGTLFLDQPFVSWELPPTLKLSNAAGIQIEEFPPVDVYQLEIEDMVAAIQNRREPLLPPDEGLKNARLLQALRDDAGL